MNTDQPARRDFLTSSSRVASAAWLALELPWLATLASCAREDARSERPFATLTRAEARTMRAFAAQVIPADDGSPGAEEAGAVYFVDRALGLPAYADSVPVIRAGLADLDARARITAEVEDFAALTAAQRIAIMRQVEKDAFFAVARTLVVIGTFADPVYGGNRDGVGWAMLGIDHRPSYSAPFGWYDAKSTTTPTKGAA